MGRGRRFVIPCGDIVGRSIPDMGRGRGRGYLVSSGFVSSGFVVEIPA